MGPSLILGLFFIGGSFIYGFISEGRRAKKEEENKKKEEENKKKKEEEEIKRQEKAKRLLERRKKLTGNRDWANYVPNQDEKKEEENKKNQEETKNNEQEKNNTKKGVKPSGFKILRKDSPIDDEQNSNEDLNKDSDDLVLNKEVLKKAKEKQEKKKEEEIVTKKEKEIENLNDIASLLKAKLLKYKRGLKEKPNYQKDRVASIEWTILYLNRYLNDELSIEEYSEVNKFLDVYKKMDKVTFELYYKNLVNKYGDKLKENRITNQRDRNLKNMIFAYAYDNSDWISEDIDLLTHENNNEYLLDSNKMHWVSIEEALGDSKLEISNKSSKDIREAVKELKKDLIHFKANVFLHKKENPLTKIRKIRGIDDLIDHLDRTHDKLSIEELEVTLDHIWFYSNLSDEKKAMEKVVEIKKEINSFQEPNFSRSQDKKKYDEIIRNKRILKERLILLNIFINKNRKTFKEVGFHRKGMHPEIPHRKENFRQKNELYKKLKGNKKRKKENPNTNIKENKNLKSKKKKKNNENLTDRVNELNKSQKPKSKKEDTNKKEKKSKKKKR